MTKYFALSFLAGGSFFLLFGLAGCKIPQAVNLYKGVTPFMAEAILLGRDQKILKIPEATWKQHLTQIPQHSQSRLKFMTDAHHQVRYFVVKEMANRQKPIGPEFISQELNIPLEQVKVILGELQEKLFFLVRNEQEAVIWAYPVTVETTSHKLSFASGERLYGA